MAVDARDFDDDDAPRRLTAFAGACARGAGGVFMRHPADAVGALLMAVAAMVICVNALALQRGSHPAPMIRIDSPVAVSLASFAEKTGSVAAPQVQRAVDVKAPALASAVPVETARSRAQIVTDIQRELARKGFYEANIDGLTGPKMDAAMRDFAQAAHVKAAIEPSEAFLQTIRGSSAAKAKPHAAAPAAVVVASAPALPRPVSRPPATTAATAKAAVPAATTTTTAPAAPSNSPQVLAVQRALGDFGYGPLKRSGQMDGDTKAAIEKFERERHMPVTGRVSDRLVRDLAALTGRPLEH